MRRISAATFLAVCALAIAPGVAAAQTVTAVGTFDASTDSAKPVNDTSPRGQVTFSQTDNGSITGTGQVSGLLPNRAYLVVAYKDGACLPTPGVTAFPSSPWTTGPGGSASFSVTVNPQAVNPAGQFTVDQTRSISIREVAVGAVNPPGTPNVPLAITEACDANPSVSTA